MSHVRDTLRGSYGIVWYGEERPLLPDYFVFHDATPKDELHRKIDHLRKYQFQLAAGHFQDFYWLCYAEKEIE